MTTLQSLIPEGIPTNPPVADMLATHFGCDPIGLPIITETFEQWDHVNVQAGLDALLAKADSDVRTVGVAVPPPPGGGFLPVESPGLASMLVMPAVKLGSVDRVNRASGPDEELSCINAGLVLFESEGTPIAVWMRQDSLLFGRRISVDVQAPTLVAAQDFLGALSKASLDHSVFRGKVVKFSADVHGNIDVQFEERPNVQRGSVILREPVMDAIESHAIGIGELSSDLKDVGRHLKRGLLLYGPPGTGKTLTMKYLVSRMPEATVFLLAGSAMSWLRFVVQRAADLQPSILVLDDVDLIAEDRNLGGMSPRRHLFDLLDSMDGLHDDIDVLFVCTTNRPEALEKAIAARPGRVDHAVEVSLPDADCRRRLFELYGNGLDLELSDLDALVERTNGVTASFVKELLRRAAVIALAHDREGTGITVTDAHVHAGLDALLDPSNPLTASLLGGVGRRTETDSDAKETS